MGKYGSSRNRLSPGNKGSQMMDTITDAFALSIVTVIFLNVCIHASDVVTANSTIHQNVTAAPPVATTEDPRIAEELIQSLFDGIRHRDVPLYLCDSKAGGGQLWKVPQNSPCRDAKIDNTTTAIDLVFITPNMSKQTIPATICKIKETTVYKHQNCFWIQHNPVVKEKYLDVTKAQCEMMREVKEIDGSRLILKSPGIWHTNNPTDDFDYRYCKMTKRPTKNYYLAETKIGLADDHRTVVGFQNQAGSCVSSDEFCKLEDGIVVWSDTHIKKCNWKMGAETTCLKVHKTVVCPKFSVAFSDIGTRGICDTISMGTSSQGLTYLLKEPDTLAPHRISVIEQFTKVLSQDGVGKQRKKRSTTVVGDSKQTHKNHEAADMVHIAMQSRLAYHAFIERHVNVSPRNKREIDEFDTDDDKFERISGNLGNSVGKSTAIDEPDSEEVQRVFYSAWKTSFKNSGESNGGLQYLYFLVKHHLEPILELILGDVCRLNNSALEYMKAMLESGFENEFVRALFADRKYRTKKLGDLLFLYECTPIYDYEFLEQNSSECYAQWPVKYKLNRTSVEVHRAFVMPNSHELTVHPTEIGKCTVGSGSYFMEYKNYVIDLWGKKILNYVHTLPSIIRGYDGETILPEATFSNQGSFTADEISSSNWLLDLQRSQQKIFQFTNFIESHGKASMYSAYENTLSEGMQGIVVSPLMRRFTPIEAIVYTAVILATLFILYKLKILDILSEFLSITWGFVRDLCRRKQERDEMEHVAEMRAIDMEMQLAEKVDEYEPLRNIDDVTYDKIDETEQQPIAKFNRKYSGKQKYGGSKPYSHSSFRRPQTTQKNYVPPYNPHLVPSAPKLYPRVPIEYAKSSTGTSRL